MNDDLNTPIVLSYLFEAAKTINLLHEGKETFATKDLDELKDVFKTFLFDILGLSDSSNSGVGEGNDDAYKGAVDLLLSLRMEAKNKKDWGTSDRIRNELAQMGIEVKDTKDGFEWKRVR